MDEKIESPGKTLYDAMLLLVEMLMGEDPAPDTLQGKMLVKLAEALEAYEKATLPPPFGNWRGVPAAQGREGAEEAWKQVGSGHKDSWIEGWLAANGRRSLE